jgi:hypothetical protein
MHTYHEHHKHILHVAQGDAPTALVSAAFFSFFAVSFRSRACHAVTTKLIYQLVTI